MEIQSALSGIFREVRRYDSHIPSPWLADNSLPGPSVPGRGVPGPVAWLMARWEAEMAKEGYSYVMLSTQEDETAKFFYGILGYQPIGAFLPLELEARVLLYEKSVPLR